MTENQNGQKVQNNPAGNQGNGSQNNQKKDNTPDETTKVKTPIKEDEKVKPVKAEDNKELDDRDHPHEVAVPVSSNNKNKSSL